MSTDTHGPEHAEALSLHALRALPATEAARLELHLADCVPCRNELQRLRDVADTFAAWPTDVLRPSSSVWERVAARVGADVGTAPLPALPGPPPPDPDWERAGPGIQYRVAAADPEARRVALLVRLEPGAHYPPHRHAGVEELHLLHGELWIEDRKLVPGDFNRAEPGTADRRVFSETGCTCLLITSTDDVLR